MKYFGYIRVSTVKQGEHGVSLQEQKDAITRYAQNHSLEIVEWFEERVTAAKRGRPIFNKMLHLLQHKKAAGVIIHKIDRGARNMKDWAELVELFDRGIEVHCANESLDLHTRGGRLSADIQAVVAADYIRNLREETRKGFYGRVKQGFYPLPAPIGYLDQGKAKPKIPDPVRAPLVKKAFELYATATYSLETLVEELYRIGLRNRRGNKVEVNRIAEMFNNPFYVGLIHLKRTNETFPGVHEAIIRKPLFDKVQYVMRSKTNARVQRHDFLYRRLLACKHCDYTLTGERKKGHVYYRCHNKNCPVTCIREEVAEQEALRRFLPLQFDEREKAYLRRKMASLTEGWRQSERAQIEALKLSVGQVRDRLRRLTDFFIDGVIDKDTFEERKKALLFEQNDIDGRIAELAINGSSIPERLAKFFELAGSAYLLYKHGLPEEKRDLLKITTSNRLGEGKNVDFTLAPAFLRTANRFEIANSGPYRGRLRTLDALVKDLIVWFEENPAASFETASVLGDKDSAGTINHKDAKPAAGA